MINLTTLRTLLFTFTQFFFFPLSKLHPTLHDLGTWRQSRLKLSSWRENGRVLNKIGIKEKISFKRINVTDFGGLLDS